tara:strand:- start:211 stop:420 length:210 start_codon:yes stop_codon:yes gene_type:complete
MEKYEFSSINPNTNKRKYFVVEAKSLQGAEKKAELQTVSHTGLRVERRISDDFSLRGQSVPALAKMLKF